MVPKRVASWTLVLFGLGAAGCWQGASRTLSTAGYFGLWIHSSTPIITQEKPAWITVDATNGSDQRVQWGEGSSSCQFDAKLMRGGEEWDVAVSRPCTQDVVPHALDPGEDRSEHWQWAGQVMRDGGPPERLPSGLYAVYAAAGTWRSEKPIYIEVRR